MILFLIVKSVLFSIRYQHALTPLIIFIGINGFWNILFSPYGSIMRFKWAWALILMILSIELAKSIAESRNKNRGVL